MGQNSQQQNTKNTTPPSLPFKSKLSTIPITKAALIIVFIAWLVPLSLKNTKDVPTPYNTDFPSFIYRDAEDPYFKHNVMGLRAKLETAASACFLNWTLPNKTTYEILFNPRTQPTTPYYIVMAMEQPGSNWFNEGYIQKLQNAAQLWHFSEFNKRSISTVYSEQLLQRSYFVPTLAYASVDVPPIKCTKDMKPAENAYFDIYYHRNIVRCTVSSNMDKNIDEYEIDNNDESSITTTTYTTGAVRKSHCLPPPEPLLEPSSTYCTDTLKHVNVLVYGFIECSQNAARETLCDRLYDAIPNVACLQDVYEETLAYFVCKAKIIVIDRYWQQAALETHRIDALLLAGKRVVVVPSMDTDLDEMYKSHVVFAERENIVQVVQALLEEMHSKAGGGGDVLIERVQQERQRIASFSQVVRDSKHVCDALKSLQKDTEHVIKIQQQV